MNIDIKIVNKFNKSNPVIFHKKGQCIIINEFYPRGYFNIQTKSEKINIHLSRYRQCISKKKQHP